MRRSRGLVVGLLLFVAGCSPRAAYHQVRAGETLERIGRAYGVRYQDIARANGRREPDRIRNGQRLRIPAAADASRRGLVAGRETRVRREPWDERAPRFEWPVPDGVVTSGFGKRGRRFHGGIDISAAAGTSVYAAAGGEVVYSGKLSGYGNVVIVRHGDGYSTLYAHNQRNHARERQWVRRGDLIATVGQTGRTTGPNLHFEIRKDEVARNPLYFLPANLASEMALGSR